MHTLIAMNCLARAGSSWCFVNGGCLVFFVSLHADVFFLIWKTFFKKKNGGVKFIFQQVLVIKSFICNPVKLDISEFKLIEAYWTLQLISVCKSLWFERDICPQNWLPECSQLNWFGSTPNKLAAVSLVSCFMADTFPDHKVGNKYGGIKLSIRQCLDSHLSSVA